MPTRMVLNAIKIREHAWRYRDWVIEAFNRDMRFDEFVRKQIAGDAINADDPQSVIATGFLVGGGLGISWAG